MIKDKGRMFVEYTVASSHGSYDIYSGDVILVRRTLILTQNNLFRGIARVNIKGVLCLLSTDTNLPLIYNPIGITLGHHR